jgi:hypothetical protein
MILGQATRQTCAGCGAAGSGRFCAECGQARSGQPSSARELLRAEAAEAISVDHRLWATLRDLLLHPVQATREYVAGSKRYLPPLRLFVTLTGLYMLGLSFAPTYTNLQAARPMAASLRQRLAAQGLPAQVIAERRDARVQTTSPLLVGLSLLSSLPVLALVKRRRPWQEHLVFLFASANAIWLWTFLSMPLLVLGYWVHYGVACLITFGISGLVYWKLYRRPSILVTAAGLVGMLVMQLLGAAVAGVALHAAIDRSLLWF